MKCCTNPIADIEKRKWEIIKELNNVQDRLINELSGIDKTTLTALRKQYAVMQSDIDKIKTTLQTLNVPNLETYESICSTINELKTKVNALCETVKEVDNYNTILSTINDTIATVNERVENLVNVTETQGVNINTLFETSDEINERFDYVTPQMFGAIGNGIADDTEAFKAMFATGKKVKVKAGNYVISKPLNVKNSIYGETDANIYYFPAPTDTYKACFTIEGNKTKLCEGVSCVIGDYTISVDSLDFSSTVKSGDFIFIESTDKASAYARDYDFKQDMLEVESVSNGVITFTTNPEWKSMSTVTLYRMNFVKDIEVANLNIQCMALVEHSSGVFISHAQNPTVRNCHISNFDYGQIDIRMSINTHVHDNYCAVNYSNELQYGIIYSNVYNATIHGNTVNSERTAIDISYGCKFVSITGNSTCGNINTHWALKCLIDGNTINNGFILIRGKEITVSNNYINTTNTIKNASCIDIVEGGKEGGHVICNNTCIGIITLTAVTSGCRIINNTFKATHCPIYYETESSMCRIGNAPYSLTDKAGCEISGNLFEYIGNDTVKYGIDMYYDTGNPEYNIRISNNVIRNVGTGINAILRGQVCGDNMTIFGNDIQNATVGIAFRGMSNTVINNNNIKAKDGGTYGIYRVSSSVDTNGLVITGNLIDGFTEGIRVYDGQGKITNAVIGNNVYVNCTTKRNVSSVKIIPQAIEYPSIEDSNGIRYKLVVVDGALSIEQQNSL